ncbi:MAG TPA: S41 family peptidase [Candidatus Baltobacteraceae bacterium]|jgi:carboxyl-terminal processing protease|nr:S41 family peptidase [Candidatus Baltobacteraceae bacterium]
MKYSKPFAFAIVLAAIVLQIPTATAAAPSTTLPVLEANEISTSYQNLTTEFYKRVEPQDVLDSVRTELDATLKHAGVKKMVPALRASDLPNANVHAIDVAVESAGKVAGSKVSTRDLSYAAISGIMDSVHDRYTVFLTPAQYADLNQGLDGSDFGGTGIVIQADDVTKYIDVSNVVPDGPADKAGIQQDDVITAIDGVSTKGMKINDASSHLRGKAGTNVSISIQRAGNALPSPVVITRAKIHQVSVFEKMLPNKIGYVALTVFGRDTGSELTTALDRLQSRGARAIIMDLRENGGGYLDSAVAVSSKFISAGPIVSIESRASSITTREADDTAITPVPLAVLVNGHTASASEITAGAIQDTGVGTIIGTKTFGKGVVQSIFPLPDKSAVKITTARYLTPHNRDINHLGITPDVVINENKGARFGDPARDAQLKRALDFIDDRVAHLNSANGPG